MAGFCEHWTVWDLTGPARERGLAEAPRVPFSLVVGTDGSCMPMPWCHAWASWFSSSDPHTLPEPLFPRAPHLPVSPPGARLPVGDCPCWSSAGPQRGKSPVPSVQRRQHLCLEGQRSLLRVLCNSKESCSGPEPQSTFLEIIKWL